MHDIMSCGRSTQESVTEPVEFIRKELEQPTRADAVEVERLVELLEYLPKPSSTTGASTCSPPPRFPGLRVEVEPLHGLYHGSTRNEVLSGSQLLVDLTRRVRSSGQQHT